MRLDRINQQTKMIVENIRDGVVLIDSDLRCSFWNPAMEEMTGIKARETIRKHYQEIFQYFSLQGTEHLIKRALNGEKVQSEDMQFFVPQTGRSGWVVGSFSPFHTKGGTVQGVLIIIVDITSRKRIEMESEESEALFHSMMGAMIEPVCVCSDKRCITYMNHAMEKRIGSDAIGASCHKAIHNLDAVCSWCVLDQVIKEGKSLTEEVMSPKDNCRFIVSHAPIFHANGSVSKMTIFRDITAWKRVETQLTESQAQLFQMQKMESLGTLVAGVAHEINNPVNLITFNTPLIQKIFRDFLPVMKNWTVQYPDAKFGGLAYNFLEAHLEQLLSDIEMAADRIAVIVSRLKDFARISDVGDKKLIDINETVVNALRLAKTTLRKANISVKKELAPDLPPINANLSSVEQVVLNLIVNSVQSIDHDNGQIVIKTAVDHARLGNILSVSDNGEGIDPAIQDNIFDPFFTRKQDQGGSGLGLSVSYSIIKAHNGEINVESQKGERTTFNVFLPFPKAEPKPVALIVDDDQWVLKTLERILMRYFDFNIMKASDGREALLKIGINKPDLMILDINMPVMDGVSVCKMIKNEPSLSKMKLIMVTGHPDSHQVEEIKALGHHKILKKPIRVSEFKDCIYTLMNKEKGNHR